MLAIRIVFHDALQAAEFRAGVEADERDALRGTPQLANLGNTGANQYSLVGYQHDFVVGMHQRGGHDLAVALTLLNRDHAFGSAAMARVLGDAGALAIAVGRGGQHALFLVAGHQHGDHALAVVQHHAAHAARVAAHRAHVVFIEAHRFAAIAEQHDIVLAVRQGRADQVVARIEIDSDDAGLARIAELAERRLLDRTHAGRHEHILVGRENAFFTGQRQHDVDFFAFLQREHVDDRAAARTA